MILTGNNMKTENMYVQLFVNFYNPAFKVDISEDSSFTVRAVDAILQRRFHRNKQPYQALIETYVYDSLTNIEKSLFLEAKINELLAGMWEEKNRDLRIKIWDEIRSLAEEALLLNPHAAISRVMLSREAIVINEDYEKGITIMLDVLKEYPDAEWGYLFMVRRLFEKGKYKLARPYIGKISTPVWRIIYFLTARFFVPFTPIIIIGYFLWVLLLAQPFWIMIAVLIPYGMISIYSWIKNDIPIKSLYTVWFFVFLFLSIVGLINM